MKRVVLAFALVACTKKGGGDELRATEQAPGGGEGRKRTGADVGAEMPTGGAKGNFVLDLDGDMEAMGAVEKDLVRKVVKDNVTKLQTCYEQTLMANPNIAGTVKATFTVDNGSVTNVKAVGVHPDVELCVIKAVQLFKFPPGTKVDVTYPFTFKPAS